MTHSLPLLVFEPPYSMVRWLRDDAPALGSILLLDTIVRSPSAGETRSVLEIAPWCPVCVVVDKKQGGRGVRRIPRTCVVEAIETADDPSQAILRGVDDRPRPTTSMLVEWVVQRTRVNTVARTLSELFNRPLLRRVELAYLPYNTRETLAQLGDWTARDWQLAAQFADCAADRTSLRRLLAADDMISLEARRHMQELLGITDQQFHDAHGWEWVLELSLRRSGFFDRGARDFRRIAARRTAAPGVAAGVPAYAARLRTGQMASA